MYTALHVSGVDTHHQELIRLWLQLLALVNRYNWSTWLTKARSCNYSCMSSWWWVSTPKTCRAVYRYVINWIVTPCWTVIQFKAWKVWVRCWNISMPAEVVQILCTVPQPTMTKFLQLDISHITQFKIQKLLLLFSLYISKVWWDFGQVKSVSILTDLSVYLQHWFWPSSQSVRECYQYKSKINLKYVQDKTHHK
jgi:hypothetical protein